MVKRIICTPTIEEIDGYIQILQNIETLNTILNIKTLNKKLEEQERKKLECDICQKKVELSEWWEMITDKYGISYYDNNMYIDSLRKSIYVFEKDHTDRK